METVKPLFSDKISHKEAIKLAENDIIVYNHQEIVNIFNSHFSNFVKNLIKPDESSIDHNIKTFKVPIY